MFQPPQASAAVLFTAERQHLSEIMGNEAYFPNFVIELMEKKDRFSNIPFEREL